MLQAMILLLGAYHGEKNKDNKKNKWSSKIPTANRV
jgi:hypothetical protein